MLYNGKIGNQITNNYRYLDFHRNKGRNEKKENKLGEEEKGDGKCCVVTWKMCGEPQWNLVKSECIAFHRIGMRTKSR